MSRYLLLLRHAKSAWDSDVAEDYERPLAKRGKKDARRMGGWMHREGLMPDYVVSSPAVRARETVYGVCQELAIQEADIHFDRRIYEADATTLLAVLADCPQGPNTILLVGHNPGLADLLAWLWGENHLARGWQTAAHRHPRAPQDAQGLDATRTRLRPHDRADPAPFAAGAD